MLSLCVICSDSEHTHTQTVKSTTNALSLQIRVINDSTRQAFFVFTLYSTKCRCLGFVFLTQSDRNKKGKEGKKDMETTIKENSGRGIK